jgi:hypothetical protein
VLLQISKSSDILDALLIENQTSINTFCPKIVCAMSFALQPPEGIVTSSENEKHMEKQTHLHWTSNSIPTTSPN